MSIVTISYNPLAKEGIVSLPLSKSIAARLLTISFLSNRSYHHNLPDCDDSIFLKKAYETANIGVASTKPVTADLGMGATSLRFFIAATAATKGLDIDVICHPQLQHRPLMPLIKALDKQGAQIEFLGTTGYPPLSIKGTQLSGNEITVDSSMSSQFTSALMLAAPYSHNPTTLIFEPGDIVSRPYINLTSRLMIQAGADVDMRETSITIPNTPYTFYDLPEIEPDWSGASYFYELAMLSMKNVIIRSLTPADKSLQGDSKCEKLFNFLGVETLYQPDGSAILIPNQTAIKTLKESKEIIELNLADTPDLTPAIVVAMTLSGIKFRITGVGHLKIKESNRLAALANELEKIGYSIFTDNDSISWTGGTLPQAENEVIETYSDHRIAMSMAIAAVKHSHLSIKDPATVGKSFPDFWNQLKLVGFRL